MERLLADVDPQIILEAPTEVDLISTYYIFTTYNSARGITLMIQKRLDKLREIWY